MNIIKLISDNNLPRAVKRMVETIRNPNANPLGIRDNAGNLKAFHTVNHIIPPTVPRTREAIPRSNK